MLFASKLFLLKLEKPDKEDLLAACVLLKRILIFAGLFLLVANKTLSRLIWDNHQRTLNVLRFPQRRAVTDMQSEESAKGAGTQSHSCTTWPQSPKCALFEGDKPVMYHQNQNDFGFSLTIIIQEQHKTL